MSEELEKRRQAFESLASAQCPACYRKKRKRESFCGYCYRKLPAPMRSALYNTNGYVERWHEAMKILKPNA